MKNGDPSRQPAALDRRVILLLGMTGRSGTNHLMDLLTLHPRCISVPAIHEDYLLAHMDQLLDFVAAVAQNWLPEWNDGTDAAGELTRCLGQGCLQFLIDRAHRVVADDRQWNVVTKSPTVTNLDQLPVLFPNTPTLVLIRDGRDVVESAMRSFGWDFEAACQRWVRAAQTIIDAERQTVPFLRLRFEDLVADCRSTMQRTFEYLQLNETEYDFEAARSLPVRGSSTFGQTSAQLHWDPVPRSDEFQPIGRWRVWEEKQLQRYRDIAGSCHRQLGYDLDA